mgnify:CR=1 FL=1
MDCMSNSQEQADRDEPQTPRITLADQVTGRDAFLLAELINAKGDEIARGVYDFAKNEGLSLKDASYQFVRKCFVSADGVRKAILDELGDEDPAEKATDSD